MKEQIEESLILRYIICCTEEHVLTNLKEILNNTRLGLTAFTTEAFFPTIQLVKAGPISYCQGSISRSVCSCLPSRHYHSRTNDNIHKCGI